MSQPTKHKLRDLLALAGQNPPTHDSWSTGYDTDFHNWTATQATTLRRLQPSSIDWFNIAEQLDDIGRSEQRALESHLTVLLVHLLKWRYQHDIRTGSWEASIENSRDEIAELLSRSPSLTAKLPEAFRIAYRRARRTAGGEMGLVKHQWDSLLPANCEWYLDQVCDSDFWPD